MKILLGISGSIAAYKTPDLIRGLVKQGVQVTPLITQNASQFVTPTTLATVSLSEVYSKPYLDSPNIAHLNLGRTAQIMVIAPATANIIAKCAHGIADDLLTSTFLSFTGPKLIVPAMHTEMYDNPITKENILKLKAHNVHFLGPDQGDLACGDIGFGRMVELDLIILKILSMFKPTLALSGKKIMISCGGTREPLDSVRVLTNRSTGQLGLTLAHLASVMGAEVTLVSTAAVSANPHLKKVILVETSAQMHTALQDQLPKHDYLYMAAAVSDFTYKTAETKIRRQQTFSLDLEGTPDILKELSKQKENKIFIGFCLADQDLEKTALEKLTAKNLDFIAANGPQNIGNSVRTLIIHSKDQSKPPVKLDQVSIFESAYQLLKLIASC